MRATTRDPHRRDEIEAAGAEAFVGDPDRGSTLAPALDHVGVACLLLGCADGSPEQLAALHGTRLDMLLERMLDTTVRGVVYESRGTVDEELLQAGAARVHRACERSLIPYALLEADPGDREAWATVAADAVEAVLLS